MSLRSIFQRRYNIMLFLIFIIALLLRLYRLGGDLYFDEGATWQVAKLFSVSDIIHGNYSIEGNPPLAYLIYKPLLLVAQSEVQLRLISVILGMVSLVFIFKIYSFSFNKGFALLGLLLLALNPVHVHYTREFRFYSLGFFSQAFSMYCYYQSIINPKKIKWIYLSMIGLLISVFTTFSSIYLIGIYFFSEIYIKKYTVYRRRILLALSIIGVSIFIWIGFFFKGGGAEALYNYTDYRNREILWQIGYTLRSLFFVRLDWGVIPVHYKIDALLEPLVRIFEIIIPTGVLFFSICLIFFMFPLRIAVQLRDRALSKFTQNECTLLKFHAVGFLLPLFFSIIFSEIAFNVISPKLLLPMVISGIWLSLYIIRIVSQMLFQQKNSPFIFGMLILLFAIGTGWISLKNSMNPKYAVRPYIDQVIGDSQSQHSCVIVSQEVAMGLVKYYEYLSGKQILSSSAIIPVGYSPTGLKKAQIAFSSLRAKPNACNLVFYLKYYDFWPQKDPSSMEFAAWLSQYKLQSRQEVDSQYLSLEIYTK